LTRYNLTNVTKSWNFIDTTSEVNRLTNGVLMFVMLIGVFLLIFIGLKSRGEDATRCLAASSFITTIVSILFLTQGWVQVFVVIIFVALTIISMILLYSENG